MSNPEALSLGRLEGVRVPPAVLTAAAVAVLAALVLVTASGVTLSAQPSATPVLDWLFDGKVTTTARVGDTLFVGGAFSVVAPDSARVGTLVTVSASTGAIVTTYPRYDSALVSLPDTAGGFYALIDVDLNGTFVRDIIHVRADGSRDPAFTFGARRHLLRACAGHQRVWHERAERGSVHDDGRAGSTAGCPHQSGGQRERIDGVAHVDGAGWAGDRLRARRWHGAGIGQHRRHSGGRCDLVRDSGRTGGRICRAGTRDHECGQRRAVE